VTVQVKRWVKIVSAGLFEAQDRALDCRLDT
jgi:hypothetical protein